jgi:acyl carrier protein
MEDSFARPIRRFVEDNYMFSEESTSLKDSDSLRDAGLIDSTGILELVTFLETTFDIQIDDADVIPENLDSIAAIAAYVAMKRAKVVEPSARE